MVSISTALLPLLALAGVASAAERGCTTEHPMVSIQGTSYSTFNVDGSSGVCLRTCLGNAKCVAYQYDFTSGACSLFSTVTKETYTPSASGSLVAARCMATADLRLTVLAQENVDYPGLDVGSAGAANPTECGDKCLETPTCFAYSWTNYNGGSCWMKSRKPDTVTGPYDGSVVSGQVFSCLTPRYDADATGTDLSSVLRTDWRDCCGVCRTTANCKGFSWSNYNGGTCWLKSAVTGFVNSAGVMAAVL